MTEQQQKQRAIDLLATRYRGMENACEGIDMRLRMYFEDLLEHSSAREDDPQDWHGLYELLGGAKFLRCLDTYNFNTKKVQTVIRLREGEWRQVVAGVSPVSFSRQRLHARPMVQSVRT